MALSELPLSIHGHPDYVNFRYQFNTLSFFLLISYTYVFLTILIVLKMLKDFNKPGSFNSSSSVQRSVFLSFIWMQSATLLFYVFDNLVFRIPPSGFMTSWLASTSPELFLKLSYYFLLISNYFSTFFSLLFCLVRLFVVYFPDSYIRKISVLFKFYIPSSLLLPFLLTLFFIPATVYCCQIGGPYSFGSIYFNYTGAWLNIYYDPFNVVVNFTATIFIICVNVALLKKVRVMMKKRTNRSSRSLRSEICLTLMTLTMNIPFIANGAMTIVSFTSPGMGSYTLFPRQIASDIGLVGVPWIFYLTHPMFRSKSPISITVSGGSSGPVPNRVNPRF